MLTNKLFSLSTLLLLLSAAPLWGAGQLLIPMDKQQNNHLKAYGVAHYLLSKEYDGKWLLNYRGGSFLFPESAVALTRLIKKGVTFETIAEQQYLKIKEEISQNNMQEVPLRKVPRLAIYTPPDASPWADAVTLVMQYAEIPYEAIYDAEVLSGDLENFDWLHLHHEDFTGQFSKFWSSHRQEKWFQEKVSLAKRNALEAGFTSVPAHKKAVARALQTAVGKGLFLFAMCTATETLDLALASQTLDIVPPELDGSPITPEASGKLAYQNTFAFENFILETSPYLNSFSDIDFNQVNHPHKRIEVSDFILFDFSAKLDPIPTLLTQSHERRIKGFFGQTTTFREALIKDGVTVLGKSIKDSVRYLTGKYGKGNFTFYGGHAPEDESHFVGDKAPDLESYKNSPGYRLILNNLLFPSAAPPKKKT